MPFADSGTENFNTGTVIQRTRGIFPVAIARAALIYNGIYIRSPGTEFMTTANYYENS